MLQIGINASEDLALRFAESVNHREAQAWILHPAKDSNSWIGGGDFLRDGPCKVLGVIIHDQYFVVDITQRKRELFHKPWNIPGFVQRW